ncbi:VOC family protein [Acidisphaera sp. S103]|uniref:VOC family protein n=1 Tax=Acidisphaera sp. S103 TaxID=1747223 RepID=UPI00131B9E57|nr:VOC family protein [Acidisphaera sp. S103]
MTEPKLTYVALITRDTAAASHLLGDVLGLRQSLCPTEDGDVPVFAAGQSALALFAPGSRFVDGETRTGVHHIGLDPGAPPPTTDAPRTALGGGIRQPLPIMETAGVRVFLTPRLDIAHSSTPLIERIDHLGIASADNQAAIALFNGRLGLPVESQQTDVEVETVLESFTSDKYGVVYHSRTPRVVGGLRVAFLTAGDCDLEFLQNFDPSHGAALGHGTAGTTRQDQGAITKFIAAQGAGLHHVALKTPDIDEALGALEQSGARMIDRIGRPGSRRARIGFIHPASFGGVLFHLVQRDPI